MSERSKREGPDIVRFRTPLAKSSEPPDSPDTMTIRVTHLEEDVNELRSDKKSVLETLAPHGLAGRVRTLALPDEFLPHGKASDILKAHGLDSAGVAKRVYEAVKGRVRSETQPG